MNRRAIFIIIAAVALALLVGFVWLTFFKTAGDTSTPGTFGSGDSRTGTGGTGSGSQNNGASNVLPGSNGTSGAGTGSAGTGGTGSGAGVSATTTAAGTITPGLSTVPGVDWLGGGGVGGLGTSGGEGSNSGGGGGSVTGSGRTFTTFVPDTIKQLNSGNVYGTPTITADFDQDGDGDVDNDDYLKTALLGMGVGGAVACTPGLLGGIVGGGINGGISTGITEAEALTAVPVVSRSANLLSTYNNTLKSNDTFRENFLDCITRVIAKVAIQHITASVVNWINSGFNGQPSFVTNYQQFFTNVADQAAGEFIKSSALSFLCSPFQNQIRTALAQSYAHRNSPSCTLTSILGNLNTFSGGGWQGILSSLGVPTNNPFGAYQYAQNGLASAQNQALTQQQQNYTIGQGFLNSTRQVNCRLVPPPAGQSGPPSQKCDTAIVTPGSVIAASLNKTLGVSQDSLNLAKSFDEIISALITQLMTKTLQEGLSNLSGPQGYASNFLTPQEQRAQERARTLLAELQAKVTVAQQYGSVEQGSIADIQNTQQQLQTLANCWEIASSTPGIAAAKQQQAQTNAIKALEVLHSYDNKVDHYNIAITRTNGVLTRLQQFQTRIIGISTPEDVDRVREDYQQALSEGKFLSDADVRTAQQDRTTLQSTLTQRNSLITKELEQCHAF
jgi:hypothetical protein